MTDDRLRDELAAVLIGGLRPTTVEIVAPDPGWPAVYADLAGGIRQILGSRAQAVEHIGSTSVPGLAAKDRIDIDLVVADPDDEAGYLDDLLADGWKLSVREPGHRCLTRAAPAANLHVFAPGSAGVADHTALRDWLRRHDDDRDAYARLKRELAGRGRWPDVNYYAQAKGPMINDMLRKARG